MNSLLFFPIYILPITAAVVFGYFTAEKRKEKDLLLKLAGYFFLGTIIFWYGWLPMPVGVAAGYFLKPKTNTLVKKRVLYGGAVVAFFTHIFIF